jgi:hypothetical protein
MENFDFSAIEQFAEAAENLNFFSRELQASIHGSGHVTTGADIRRYSDSIKLEKWVEQWDKERHECLRCWWLELAKDADGIMVLASFHGPRNEPYAEFKCEKIASKAELSMALLGAISWITSHKETPTK